MPNRSLAGRRGRPALALRVPLPDVVLERTLAERHRVLLPSLMPRGFRSTDPAGAHRPGSDEEIGGLGGLGTETQATLGYGDWASALAPVAAPAPAPEEGDGEAAEAAASVPEASQAQNLPAPVTPVTQMIPAVPETPPKPTDSAAQKPVLPTMELDSDEPFTTRWDLAIQNLDDESVRMLIRACFYGGRTIPLSFVVRRQYLVGNTARTFMRDLGFIARRFKLASIGFPPNGHVNINLPAINHNDLDQFTITMSKADSAILLKKLLDGQTLDLDAGPHAGKALCSNACHCIMDLQERQFLKLEPETPHSHWLELEGMLFVFLERFREHMLPQMAIFGSHRQDETTVQLLARFINLIARRYLGRHQWLQAHNRALAVLYLIDRSTITPRAGWVPRGFRFEPNFDADITEYKSVVFRREKMIAKRLIDFASQRRVPPRAQFFMNLPTEDFFNFDEIEDTIVVATNDDYDWALWEDAEGVEDPARMLGAGEVPH